MIKLINILSELIDPSEAYSDIDAINTVADGKRKIAFVPPVKGNIREEYSSASK